jgi:hypothetical protein
MESDFSDDDGEGCLLLLEPIRCTGSIFTSDVFIHSITEVRWWREGSQSLQRLSGGDTDWWAYDNVSAVKICCHLILCIQIFPLLVVLFTPHQN